MPAFQFQNARPLTTQTSTKMDTIVGSRELQATWLPCSIIEQALPEEK